MSNLENIENLDFEEEGVLKFNNFDKLIQQKIINKN